MKESLRKRHPQLPHKMQKHQKLKNQAREDALLAGKNRRMAERAQPLQLQTLLRRSRKRGDVRKSKEMTMICKRAIKRIKRKRVEMTMMRKTRKILILKTMKKMARKVKK